MARRAPAALVPASPSLRRARHGAAALLVALLAAACSDDTTDGTGGSATSSTGGEGGASTTSTTTSSSSSTTSTGGADPGAGGQGSTGSGGAYEGGGGAAPEPVAPWPDVIERCGDGTDDDEDGRVDEDCAPSLFSGVFVPAGTGLADPIVLDAIEADAGATLPVIQTYRSTSAAGATNARADLEAIWSRGSVPHLNVEPSGYTPGQYAAAGDDAELAADVAAMADAVAASLSGHPEGRILLTFGAEMNGDWVDWGCLAPPIYIDFYRWAHGVFDDALAARSPAIDPRRVRWVFGPNNVSTGGCAAPAAYYPGHAYTDYLGMSAYRSGTQSIASAVVDPAHTLLDGVAMPDAWQRDRFIVLQTGTRDEPADDRDQWIRDLWTTLAADDVFRGVIYFDAADWSVIDAAGDDVEEHAGYQGLVDAIADAPLPDAGLAATFEPFFWDVPYDHASYAEIQSLRSAGLSSGCGTAPPRFCPDAALTRADAAVLLGRAFEVAPLAPATASHADVPADHPAHGLVEALTALGALAPCAEATFCPADPIARIDLARALVRLAAVEGSSDLAPFADLDTTGEDGAIQLLAELELVDGCIDHVFCPDDDVIRDVGARWIVRTAGVAPATSP